MKINLLGFLLVWCIVEQACGQEWHKRSQKDEISFSEGIIFNKLNQKQSMNARFNMSFFEGVLQIQKEQGFESYSPRQIPKFILYDSTWQYWREFRSVETSFWKKEGHKSVFLEIIYEGNTYSLYRRYLPDTKLTAVVIPGLAAWWTSATVQPAWFIKADSGLAIQIAEGKENFSKKPPEPHKKLQIDKYFLILVLGDRWDDARAYAKENKLNFRNESDLIEILKHLNGSSFSYNREDRPKQLR